MVEVDGTKNLLVALLFLSSGLQPNKENQPFSGALGGAVTPGAFGSANLANDTGLKLVGFLTEPDRFCCLPSVRLASDSEPPSEAVSSPPSDPDATPFSSKAREAIIPVPCFEISLVVSTETFSFTLGS